VLRFETRLRVALVEIERKKQKYEESRKKKNRKMIYAYIQLQTAIKNIRTIDLDDDRHG